MASCHCKYPLCGCTGAIRSIKRVVAMDKFSIIKDVTAARQIAAGIGILNDILPALTILKVLG